MNVKTKLNLMMFLEYAAKGVWIPLASVFLGKAIVDGGLGFTQGQKGWIIAISSAIGAMCAPFICRLCDKKVATEKCLGFLLFFVGILMIITARQTSFTAWLWLTIAFSILYVPTIALTNSLAMAHLKDPTKEFSMVRVWGTIGWIAVAWIFPMIWLQSNLQLQWLPPFFTGEDLPDRITRTIDSVTVAGCICLVYSFYCWFFLPHTPPKARDKKFKIGEALAMFRHKSFCILMLVALLISVVHFIYFIQMGSFLEAAGLETHELLPAMSLGQVSEILMLALLGGMLAKFGFRWIMVLGAGSFALRYYIFSLQLPVSAYVTAQLLHGICFGCFYASAFIYVDRLAPQSVRYSAQALFAFVMYGLGPLIAGKLNMFLANTATKDGSELVLADYGSYWRWTAIIALIATVLLAIFFRDETKESSTETPEAKNDE